MTEKESAAFVCEVSHDEVEGQWFKGDVKIKAGDNIKMRQEGVWVLCSQFNIIVMSDSGL